MYFESYIHGVPYGFCYKGPIHEKETFFKRFYQNRRGINEMRIEAFNTDGHKYFYYTYIIGKNVVDGQQGRPGAYFGLTIKLDQYYTKARNLYYLLDSFFNSYLLNQVIIRTDNSYKFLIRDFGSNSTIDTSLLELKKLIGMIFSPADLRNLSFHRTTNYTKLNIADASDDKVQEALAKYGEVSISADYPLQAVQHAESCFRCRLDESQRQNDNIIADLRRRCGDAENRVNLLSTELESAKAAAERYRNHDQEITNELIRLKEGLRNKDNELMQYEELKKRMEKIREIVSVDTTKGLSNKSNKHPKFKLLRYKLPHSKLKKFRLLLVVALIVLIVLLFFRIFKSYNETPILPEIEARLERKNLKKKPKKKTADGTKEDVHQDSCNHEIFPGAKIDIAELSRLNKFLKLGEEYHITVKNINPDIKGTWSCDANVQITEDESKGGCFKFTPSEKGDYTLCYEVICKQVISRTIHVTE